jgi:hypothetical protein
MIKILLFVVLVAVFTFASLNYGLGLLPGDIVIDRGDGFYFYAPFTTALLVSLLLSVAFWLVRR